MLHPSPPRHRHPEARSHVRDSRTPHRSSLRHGDYAFACAGYELRIGPVAFWSVVGVLVLMAAWTLATASYFAFHDDLLTRLIARETAMQYGYEDRVAELRMQIDRLASRQLLDQEQYEKKLETLVRRESALESRAAALASLPDPTPTGALKAPHPATEASVPLKPSPISDTIILKPAADRRVQLESRLPPVSAANADPGKAANAGVNVSLARLESALNRLEARQFAALSGVEESYGARARRMRSVIADLGIDLGKPASGGVGGPFVPAKLPAEASVFERQLYRINLARGEVDLLSRSLVSVPVRRPIAGEIDTSSGFGVRLDPFLHRPAMHTGVDFRGDVGEPIHVTAAGTVTHAGWSGGYGRMVEVDHGNGLSTRYGHLSAIEVSVGDKVRVGEVVGRLGSTGRSTGPHLHYETRIDGEAVDPQKFLRAGLRLGGGL